VKHAGTRSSEASPVSAQPWSQRVGALTAAPALVRSLGVDPEPIMRAAGLPPDAFDDPSHRIPFAALARFLSDAAVRTACPHFGLLAGRIWHLADLGAPGEIVRHSPTLGRALQEFVLLQHRNSSAAMAFLLQRDGVADFGYAVYDPQARGTLQVYDTAIAVATNMIRELCGEGFSPSEVFLPHRAPADTSPYRRFFRAPVRFDAEFCALRFPASLLSHLIEGARAGHLRSALADLSSRGKADLVQAVHRALRTLLLVGKSSGTDVARALAMHRRTLNRRLGAAGTTFQQVLDSVRFALAKELLEGSSIALDDVAAALGYAGIAPFMRAFRRWSGTTPGEWRKAMRAA
jgi:AraC-like DNA-binding protein